MELVEHNPAWANEFEEEKKLIESVLEEEEILGIEHIGSTAIPGIKAKSIVDIAVLVMPDEFIQGYVRPLSKIGYEFFPNSSSTERLFFRKGNPVHFHLSVTEEGKTPYWERQIQFRDYLISHPDRAKEYENLKIELLKSDPEAGQKYTDGKSEFINKILKNLK